ncbi:hypothetical protein L207DRAFT_216016 [Hyaloscypha variabilis F]|uniref:Uncharacterized protein n=1 Tax=Hyaloscypha variabilis (strain UAMH 11265 / GT02V1 / F) TaxID=1149755 RepID=A0A2J6S723_HYAVF|nr:hypothetical protein L207DRAFT_216016 [Hyaloscypha variabilis F]
MLAKIDSRKARSAALLILSGLHIPNSEQRSPENNQKPQGKELGLRGAGLSPCPRISITASRSSISETSSCSMSIPDLVIKGETRSCSKIRSLGSHSRIICVKSLLYWRCVGAYRARKKPSDGNLIL